MQARDSSDRVIDLATRRPVTTTEPPPPAPMSEPCRSPEVVPPESRWSRLVRALFGRRRREG